MNQYNWSNDLEYKRNICIIPEFDFESFKKAMIRFRTDKYHRYIEFLFKKTYKIKVQKDGRLVVYSVYDPRYRGESLACPAYAMWGRRKSTPFCFECAEFTFNCSGKKFCKLIEAKEISGWGRALERDKKLKELFDVIVVYFTKERMLTTERISVEDKSFI